jgi:hypothetical protein
MVAVRLGLALFVLAWLFDPLGMRSTVPLWLPFLIALGLELHFFVGAWRAEPADSDARGRLPQAVDRERYGYTDEPGELMLVRDRGRELWIPYAGESAEELDALIEEAQDRDELDDDDDDDQFAPEPRRPLRRLLVGVAVIAALGAVAWFAGNRGWNGLDAETRAAATTRFSDEASRIVGRPVEIRCDEAGEFVGAVQHADGVAAVGGRLAYLTPELCHRLYRLAFEDDLNFSQTARAIAVLAHEAWHLRGERNEGVTECYALQSGVELGMRFGLGERTARQLMRQQLAENQLRGRGSVEYLVPPECRDGGALDLDPGSSRFP